MTRVLAFVAFISLGVAAADSADLIELQDCVVSFAADVQVPALETGRVADVSIALNDTIKAGDAMARLDDRSLLIRRRAALLRLNAAKHETADDIDLEYAETALAEAQAELDTSNSIHQDVRGAVPLSQIRRLRLAVQRGELEVAQAKKRRKIAEVEVELREADLSVLDDQIRNLHVASPVTGIVLDVARSAGEWIEKGQPIATVARIDRLHVHALISSDRVSPRTCPGQRVSVHWTDATDGSVQSLRGKVLSVDPQMLPGGRFRLHAEIINEPDPHDGRQWKLNPGTDVRMRLYISVAANPDHHPKQR